MTSLYRRKKRMQLALPENFGEGENQIIEEEEEEEELGDRIVKNFSSSSLNTILTSSSSSSSPYSRFVRPKSYSTLSLPSPREKETSISFNKLVSEMSIIVWEYAVIKEKGTIKDAIEALEAICNIENLSSWIPDMSGFDHNCGEIVSESVETFGLLISQIYYFKHEYSLSLKNKQPMIFENIKDLDLDLVIPKFEFYALLFRFNRYATAEGVRTCTLLSLEKSLKRKLKEEEIALSFEFQVLELPFRNKVLSEPPSSRSSSLTSTSSSSCLDQFTTTATTNNPTNNSLGLNVSNPSAGALGSSNSCFNFLSRSEIGSLTSNASNYSRKFAGSPTPLNYWVQIS